MNPYHRQHAALGFSCEIEREEALWLARCAWRSYVDIFRDETERGELAGDDGLEVDEVFLKIFW